MARRPREGPRPPDQTARSQSVGEPAAIAPSETQMVPRLPDALSAPQSTLVYHQPMAHPAERARAFREPLGLPSLVLFPTLRGPSESGGSGDGDLRDDAGRCRL